MPLILFALDDKCFLAISCAFCILDRSISTKSLYDITSGPSLDVFANANSPGRRTSMPSVRIFGVSLVDSFEVALYAPAKQPRCWSQSECSPHRYALIILLYD